MALRTTRGRRVRQGDKGPYWPASRTASKEDCVGLKILAGVAPALRRWGPRLRASTRKPLAESYGALTALENGTFTVGKGGETWLVPFAAPAPVIEGSLRCLVCLPPQ